MDFHAPYLEAIQAIPGNTAEAKFRWIATVIKERLSACKSLEEVVESEKIPRLLAPLVQIEAAKILNKRDPGNQSNYEAIAEALKSEDLTVVNRALQASNFFNGKNKSITNVQYFFDHLFPYVSLNTRIRIVKVLSRHLARKEPSLAEEFFSAIATTYGVEQALPLLPACDESFAYEMILKHRIVLSRKLVKVMFHKNPDFVVRYLKLSKPSADPCERNLHRVDIYEYSDFLRKLIKKRLEAFVELYEMHSMHTIVPRPVRLSNKCAEAFLKNGKEHLQRNPRVYIKLLPLRMISTTLMEAIYPKLFPERAGDCETDEMLGYLDNYPQDRKLSLFTNTYGQVYGENILDNTDRVTPKLMKLLPAEERIRQARIKLSRDDDKPSTIDYRLKWRSYLSTKESLPLIKEEIARTSEMEMRAALLSEMVYSCKVNSDDAALLEVLKYLKDRHKNEQPWFLLKVLDTLLKEYDLPQISQDHWSILLEVIRRAHVKDELLPASSITTRILEAAVHFKLIHDAPIDQIVDMIVDVKSMRFSRTWNMLQKYPEYERKCLEACLNVASERYHSDKAPWKEDKTGILMDLVSSIYEFNSAHVVERNSRIEAMSVKNYPWLLREIETIIVKGEQDHVYVINNLRDIFARNEKDLFHRFWPDKSVEKIDLRSALALLKNDPQRVTDKWKDYLKWCQEDPSRMTAKRFVKAIRWYNDIPMRFVQQCVQDVRQKKSGGTLNTLAVLLHGQTFARFLETLIPAGKTIDIDHQDAKSNYNLVHFIPCSVKYTNPPVSLDLMNKMYEGDYFSLVIGSLTNLCRRTSLPKVIPFAKTLAGKRVSVRKHGIRLMTMVAPRDQLHEFLLTLWKTEDHPSIREVLFSKARISFSEDPEPSAWNLLNQMMLNLTLKDVAVMNELIDMTSKIPNEYIVEFINLLLATVDSLAEAGLNPKTVTMYTRSLLRKIDPAICDLLPEDYTEKLLRRFLFHPVQSISKSAGSLVVMAYLLPAKDKLEPRMKLFSAIFLDTVKTGWNVPDPRNPRFFPVNYAVHSFVDYLIQTYCSQEMDSRLIDGMLKTFLAVLKPEMDATSYLLLVFAKEQAAVKTPREFGAKIAEILPGLVAIFSSLFLSFMTSTLRYFLESRSFKDYDTTDVNLGVIEGLLDGGSIDANLMAVGILSPLESKVYADRYDEIVRKFGEIDHPAIKGFLYDNINKMNGDEKGCS